MYTTSLLYMLNTLSLKAQKMFRVMNTLHSKPYRSYMMKTGEFYDVIIVGGGLVGMSLACALGQSHLFKDKRIILLETMSKKLPKSWGECAFQNRVSTITPATKKLLEDIGIWKEIEERRFNAFHKMQVWDSSCNASIRLDAYDVQANEMAYCVENDVIVESSEKRANKLNDVLELCYNEKVKSIDFHRGKCNVVTVRLGSGRELKTTLLLGVDGANSFVRRSSGIKTVTYDYNQHAVVANVRLENGENNTAWQRFLPTGPIALLPLSNKYCNLIWSTTPYKASRLMEMSDNEFVSAVNAAFTDINYTLTNFSQKAIKNLFSILNPGGFSQTSFPLRFMTSDMREKFPLSLQHASTYVGERVALLGDAAHKLHPMAGQGVNLGFADIPCLVNVIEQSLKHGADFGKSTNLFEYESKRQREVLPMMAATHGLHHLYQATLSQVVFARSIGLQLTDALPIAKNSVMKYAMG